MTQYYVETDGKIYLVEEKGRLKFPRSKEKIPFSIRPRAKMDVESKEVVYAEPVISQHPRKWLNKEDIPLMDNVESTVRKAVNFSLPRVVVEAVIRDRDRVLLVKPSRGYNRDYWTLPGGFLVYGEEPLEAVEREVEEEINVKPRVKRLLNVFSAIGDQNSYQWIIFYYLAEIPGEVSKIQPKHEIKQLKWCNLNKAGGSIHSSLMKRGYEQVLEKLN
ncbi:NUDIX hydrolase [Candidatus Bipolaricaulota bacterium]|nr:NUDIX hydrolase [Candidatus Bipolaricaulota bacterium]